jgi:hypothetical protein
MLDELNIGVGSAFGNFDIKKDSGSIHSFVAVNFYGLNRNGRGRSLRDNIKFLRRDASRRKSETQNRYADANHHPRYTCHEAGSQWGKSGLFQ